MFVSAVCTGVFNPSPITLCDVAQGNTVGRLHLRILRFSAKWITSGLPVIRPGMPLPGLK